MNANIISERTWITHRKNIDLSAKGRTEMSLQNAKVMLGQAQTDMKDGKQVSWVGSFYADCVCQHDSLFLRLVYIE